MFGKHSKSKDLSCTFRCRVGTTDLRSVKECGRSYSYLLKFDRDEHVTFIDIGLAND